MQSQGHQSMSLGTALFILWFPVLVFRNLVWCFPIGPLRHVRSALLSWRGRGRDRSEGQEDGVVRSPSPVRLAKDDGHRSCRRSCQ